MTELIIYKSNILKNYNFTESNTGLAPDGVNIINYWETNGEWSLIDGQAIISNSAGALLTQSNILYTHTKYLLKINIESMTGSIAVHIGSNIYFVSVTGVSTFNVFSNTGSDVSVMCGFGTDVTINWIEVIPYPNVINVDVDDIIIPLTYSIADVKDISKRNTNFSKTVRISGTANNNILFNEIFEISASSQFNPNKFAKAVVREDGIEVFNGVMQLKNIIRTENGLDNYDKIDYDINLLGQLFDLYSKMGNTLLSDLKFDEYEHLYTASNIISSMNGLIKYNGSNFLFATNGLTSNMIDCYISTSGRAIIEFNAPHSFVVDDVVNVISSNVKNYNGLQRVFSVPSNTEIEIYYPYVLGTTGITGAVYTHQLHGRGYVYPMNYLGDHSDGSTHDGIKWKVTDFVPSIYLNEYLLKIQKRFGVTFISSLFSSDNFKRLILTPSIEKFKPTYKQMNNAAFQAERTTAGNSGNYALIPGGEVTSGSGIYYMFEPGNSFFDIVDLKFDNDSTAGNFDNNNTYNPLNGYWTPIANGTYKLSTNIKVSQQMTLPSNIVPFSNSSAGQNKTVWAIQVYDYTTNSVVQEKRYNYFYYIAAQRNYSNVILPFITLPFNALAGHNYGIRIRMIHISEIQVGLTSGFLSPITVYWQLETFATFFNELVDTTYNDGDLIDVNSAVPNMKCSELMTTLTNKFNLFIEQDKDNSSIYYIETRDDFYAAGTTIDLTKKLDVGQDIDQQPLGELTSKQYLYTFKKSGVDVNKKYFDNSNVEYGSKTLVIDNDFLPNDSVTKTELATSSGIIREFPLKSNKNITDLSGTDNKRIKDNPRILYFTIDTAFGSSYPTWDILSTVSGDTISNMNLFPAATHLDKVRGPKFDFNFFYPADIFFNSNQYTSANLYNLYHKRYIDEITSPDSKLVTLYLYLKPSDILTLKFNNIYIIDGHYLRLNKIIDYVVGQSTPTKCEFTKIITSTDFVQTHMRYLSQNSFAENTLDGYDLPKISNYLDENNRYNSVVRINGYDNNINQYGSMNISIIGNDNTLDGGNNNIQIIGSNGNYIVGGIDNVTLINSNGLIITEPDVTYINNINIRNILGTAINIIDGQQDSVLYPFNSNSPYNFIDAGVDNILGIGSPSIIKLIDGGNYA